jgi:SAM-dependent methyltransferase
VNFPERIVPDETASGIVAIHLKRYDFALPYCIDNEVLDAGCGVGYGSAYLGEVARSVVGVDRSAEALAYANRRYASDRVAFLEGDLLALPFPDDRFDVVCAFEVIEHVAEPARFLDEARRVLRPGAVFVVSTPRVDRTNWHPSNPFHAVELSRADFESLLRQSFEHVEVYGQRRLQTTRHRLAQRIDVLGLRRRLSILRHASGALGTPTMAEVGMDGIVISPDRIDRSSELVAVCRG